MDPAVTLVASALLVWQVITTVPQLVKLIRSRDVAGVSLGGDGLTTVIGAGWFLHGVQVGDTATAISGMLVIGGYGPTVTVAHRIGARINRVDSVTVIGAAAIVLAVMLAGGPMAVMLVGAPVVQYWPYVRDVLGGAAPSGVSVATSWLRAAYGGGWGLYAAMTGSVPLLVWSATTVLTFGFVAVVARRRTAVGVASPASVAVG